MPASTCHNLFVPAFHEYVATPAIQNGYVWNNWLSKVLLCLPQHHDHGIHY